MRIIQIEDSSYAVGLWWQIPDVHVSKRKMLKLARAMAMEKHIAKSKYNFVAIQPDQYGLARHDDPLPTKTISLAAALQPRIKHDAYLGIFCLGESLWWVCCKLHGMTAADGDVICQSKTEALKVADDQRKFMGDHGHEEVLHDTPAASLAYLQPLLWTPTPLRPLHAQSHHERLILRGLIGSVGVLLFCLVSSCIYGQYQARQQASQIARRSALKEAQKREYLAHPEQFFRKTWLDAPDVVSAGIQCTNAILSLPVSTNVWMLEEAVCSPGGSVRVSWAHRKGASFVALPAGAKLISPQEAVENRPLPGLPAAHPHSANRSSLMSKEEATSALYEITQNIRGHLSLVWDPPEQYKVDEETIISAPWQRGRFDISQLPAVSFLGPDLFGALNHQGAGLMSLTRKNKDLTIKGYIYANVF